MVLWGITIKSTSRMPYAWPLQEASLPWSQTSQPSTLTQSTHEPRFVDREMYYCCICKWSKGKDSRWCSQVSTRYSMEALFMDLSSFIFTITWRSYGSLCSRIAKASIGCTSYQLLAVRWLLWAYIIPSIWLRFDFKFATTSTSTKELGMLFVLWLVRANSCQSIKDHQLTFSTASPIMASSSWYTSLWLTIIVRNMARRMNELITSCSNPHVLQS